MWFLLFLRILPAVSVAELKEVMPAPLRFITGRKVKKSSATPEVGEAAGMEGYER
jgi:hypothetical protein